MGIKGNELDIKTLEYIYLAMKARTRTGLNGYDYLNWNLLNNYLQRLIVVNKKHQGEWSGTRYKRKKKEKDFV